MDRSVDPIASTKKRLTYPDRITLDQAALEKINSWLDQVMSLSKGLRVTRADLVNWLIKNQPDTLLPTQLKQIETSYFDPVKHAQWALAQVIEAKARGESITIRIINESVQNLNEGIQRPKRLRRKRAVANKLDPALGSDDQTKAVK